jgi:hypothetical protein
MSRLRTTVVERLEARLAELRASNKMGMDRVMPCVAFANK